MSILEQEQNAAQARQRQITREGIQAQIAAVEQRLATFDREIADKKALLKAIAAIEAAAIALPTQVAAKTVVVGGAGLHSSTIPCLRTELSASLAGAMQVQAARLDTLTTRRQIEAKRLNSMRDGIREFEEAGA